MATIGLVFVVAKVGTKREEENFTEVSFWIGISKNDMAKID